MKAIDKAPNESRGIRCWPGSTTARVEFEKTMAAWNKRAERSRTTPRRGTRSASTTRTGLADKKLSRDEAKDYAIKGIEAEDKALRAQS